jgi:hypothetical protein
MQASGTQIHLKGLHVQVGLLVRSQLLTGITPRTS